MVCVLPGDVLVMYYVCLAVINHFERHPLIADCSALTVQSCVANMTVAGVAQHCKMHTRLPFAS